MTFRDDDDDDDDDGDCDDDDDDDGFCNSFQAEYLALACQLSEYAVKLLDKVHGNEELNTILNSRTNLNEVEETFLQLPRLQLAIKYKEKKVFNAIFFN